MEEIEGEKEEEKETLKEKKNESNRMNVEGGRRGVGYGR